MHFPYHKTHVTNQLFGTTKFTYGELGDSVTKPSLRAKCSSSAPPTIGPNKYIFLCGPCRSLHFICLPIRVLQVELWSSPPSICSISSWSLQSRIDRRPSKVVLVCRGVCHNSFANIVKQFQVAYPRNSFVRSLDLITHFCDAHRCCVNVFVWICMRGSQVFVCGKVSQRLNERAVVQKSSSSLSVSFWINENINNSLTRISQIVSSLIRWLYLGHGFVSVWQSDLFGHICKRNTP